MIGLEKNGLQMLIDLHTVPGSQNGYDNGGLTGVCKWHKNPQDVAYAISVLERLAERYKNRPGLYGIEVLNEPISFLVYITAPSTGRARDRQEAKGSSYVPMTFLKSFYKEVYRRLRTFYRKKRSLFSRWFSSVCLEELLYKRKYEKCYAGHPHIHLGNGGICANPQAVGI